MLTAPAGTMTFLCLLFILLGCLIPAQELAAQSAYSGIPDSLPGTQKDSFSLQQSLKRASARVPSFSFLSAKKDSRDSIPVKQQLKSKLHTLLPAFLSDSNNRRLKDTGVVKKLAAPFGKYRFDSKPKHFIQSTGGYVSYELNYRSNIDTPFAEKNITQHTITGSAGVQLFDKLPLRINFWVRQSNSKVFRDIADVQVSLDQMGFNKMLRQKMQNTISKAKSLTWDSLLEKSLQLNLAQKLQTEQWLQGPAQRQRYTDYKEILQYPDISYTGAKGDSAKAQEIIQTAKTFIGVYDSVVAKYQYYRQYTDSLERAFFEMKRQLRKLDALLNGQASDWVSVQGIKDSIGKYGSRAAGALKQQEWLYGIRALSIGRTPLNYSALTTRNINITGINFEYNSWYYAAITAGTVDYRFRDFVINRFNRLPQVLYMARLGIGRVEGNHIILSYFNGKKQLFQTGVGAEGQSGLIQVQGYTLEARWQLHKTTAIVAEAGESLSPDYRVRPSMQPKAFHWGDRTNKALSVALTSWIPATNSRIEARYQYTGANYQSFSSFQNNAEIRAWAVKYDQRLFKRTLRISLGIKQNDFSNPYLVQQYQNNNVVKTAVAVFRKRRWPTITLGYIPITQTTLINNMVMQQQFQSFSGSILHHYKIGKRNTISTITVNRFYNKGADTAYSYANASSVVAGTEIIFSMFTAGFSVSHTQSPVFQLTVMEEHFNWTIFKNYTMTIGTRINNLDRKETKVGFLYQAQFRVGKTASVGMSMEKAYFMGSKGGLIASSLGTIQLTKQF